MPKKNGFEVLEELKKNPTTHTIPVFVFTSLYDEENTEEALKRGAAKVISKNDYEPNEIVEMIKKFISVKA